MRYQIWRIIGNDLPPRHTVGTFSRYLQTILNEEDNLLEADKCFLFNRIVDPRVAVALQDVCAEAGVFTVNLPFDAKEYDSLKSLEDRILYLTNVNRARNQCIEVGFAQGADVVLPLDGCCLFTSLGWINFWNFAEENPEDGGYLIPMGRGMSVKDILSSVPAPMREEYELDGRKVIGITEPQIAFTKQSDFRFAENWMYGHLSKIELLWRLGVPGVWDYAYPERDVERKRALSEPSGYYGALGFGGMVHQMTSGNVGADKNNVKRFTAQVAGCDALIDYLDKPQE